MQIRQRRGRLSYGSAFKLFFVGWFFGWALLIIPLGLVLVIIAAVGGTATVDADPYSFMRDLMKFVPALIFLPLIITIQGGIVAAAMTAGIWLYQRIRPITVSGSEDVF